MAQIVSAAVSTERPGRRPPESRRSRTKARMLAARRRVWESEEDSERLAEERLHPVVPTMLREIFGDELAPEPERTPLSMIHVWRP